ncbi:DUF805 domain-containing protein [Arthrobacter sp. D1-29]
MSYPQQQQQQPFLQAGEPPLWAPYYGAPLPVAVKRFFKKYATFSGRASRSEYWWWTLVSVGVSIILQIVAGIMGAAGATVTADGTAVPGAGAVPVYIILVIWGLATIVPSLALTARRLHDVNLSGWLILVVLVPFLGAIALLVMTILASKPEGQRFDQPGSM